MPINQAFEEGRPTKNMVYKDSCLPNVCQGLFFPVV